MRNRFGKLIKLPLIPIVFLTFYSCQKDTTDNSSNSLDSSNYLILQDRNELLEIYEKLVNNDELISSYAKENGYTSSIQVLEEFEKLANEVNVTSSEVTSYLENFDVLHVSEDSSVELIIEDPVFSALINQRGLIQVSDTLFKFRRDDIVAIPIEIKTGQPVTSIVEVENFTATNEDLGITIIPIIRSVSNSYSKSEDCDKKCIEEYALKHRLRGKIWNLNLEFIKSTGVSSKSQKKFLFIWVGRIVPSITVKTNLLGDLFGTTLTRQHKSSAILVDSYGVATQAGLLPNINPPRHGEHRLTTDNGNFECTTCRE